MNGRWTPAPCLEVLQAPHMVKMDVGNDNELDGIERDGVLSQIPNEDSLEVELAGINEHGPAFSLDQIGITSAEPDLVQVVPKACHRVRSSYSRRKQACCEAS